MWACYQANVELDCSPHGYAANARKSSRIYDFSSSVSRIAQTSFWRFIMIVRMGGLRSTYARHLMKGDPRGPPCLAPDELSSTLPAFSLRQG